MLKRGWYKKGNTHRFLHAVNTQGFYLYQTKRKFGSNEVIGINPDFDDWFEKAKYLGMELE